MPVKLEIKNKVPRPVSSQANQGKGKSNVVKEDTGKAAHDTVPEKKPQCKAARADKKRCTRVTTQDSELCYWHIGHHEKYGMYVEEPVVKKGKKSASARPAAAKKSKLGETTASEQPVIEGQPVEPPKPKTRGRKRKQAIDPRFNDPAYITMWPEICDGICVMVDRNDNVYTYGTDPVTFLGVKLLTGKINRNADPRSGF
jgi:hypothetical protein